MKYKKTAAAAAAVIVAGLMLGGCGGTGGDGQADVSAPPAEQSTDTVGIEGIVMSGIDVPEHVLEAAKDDVSETYNWMKDEFADYNYVNWRIESLVYSYTYEDLRGMEIEVYRMNYELLSATPENIRLAGGMYVTGEGWGVPSYPDCTYLFFEKSGDSYNYLFAFMANDCEAGDETFTSDLINWLDNMSGENS